MEFRRVVVTGIGAVTPLGAGVDNIWRRILNGESGAGAIQGFDVSDLAVKIACEVPVGDRESGAFNPDDHVPPKDQRKMDRFIIYGIGAADEAIADAGWTPDSEEELERTGVMIGSGIGGLETIAEAAMLLRDRGRGAYPRSLFRPASSISPRVRYPSSTDTRVPIMRLSRRAPPVHTRSAMPRV